MNEGTSISVRDDPENHQYVAESDGVPAGKAVYHLRGGLHYFVHTEVDDDFAGQGIGTILIREALDDVRARGGMIVPLCPFVARYLHSHPDYDAMVDWEMLDRIGRPGRDGA
jgi:predicted GNAT family acetyltransferase